MRVLDLQSAATIRHTLQPAAPRQPDLLVGAVENAFFDPLPEQELDAWER